MIPEPPSASSISRYLSGKRISSLSKKNIIWYYAYIRRNKWAGKRRDDPYTHRPGCITICDKFCPYPLLPMDEAIATKALKSASDIDASNYIDNALSIVDMFPRMTTKKSRGEHVLKLAEHLDLAIRPLDKFSNRSKSEDSRFTELLRYLFCPYTFPAWIEAQFLTDSHAFFVMVGPGRAVDHFKDLTHLNLSKQASHFAFNAPDAYSFRSAVVYGLARAAKCNSYIAEKISSTRFYDYCLRDYQAAVAWLQWLGCQPMFDVDRITEMVDYILNRQICMKGRTMASFMRLVDDWHIEVAAAAKAVGGIMPASSIPNFSFVEKRKDKETEQYEEILWEITNIITGKDLRQEGKEMRHCVGSYTSSIINRRCDIFSMKMNGTRTATIEVRIPDNVIVQARGKLNQKLGGRALSIMEKWAVKNRVRIRNVT